MDRIFAYCYHLVNVISFHHCIFTESQKTYKIYLPNHEKRKPFNLITVLQNQTDFNNLIMTIPKLNLGVSICLDLVSIETLNLDIIKKFASTVKKILTFSKSLSRQSRNLNWDQDFSISSRHQCSEPKDCQDPQA